MDKQGSRQNNAKYIKFIFVILLIKYILLDLISD